MTHLVFNSVMENLTFSVFKLRGFQILDYIMIMREIERIKRFMDSKDSALGELNTVFRSNLVVSHQNTANQNSGLGKDLLHGLQLGIMTILNNLEVVDQAVTGLRHISGMSPVPAAPAPVSTVLDQTGSLLVHNGRVVLSLL